MGHTNVFTVLVTNYIITYNNLQPPFSMNRFTGMLMVGYSWGQMMMCAVPPDEFWGINLRYLNYLVPLVAALGEWCFRYPIHILNE